MALPSQSARHRVAGTGRKATQMKSTLFDWYLQTFRNGDSEMKKIRARHCRAGPSRAAPAFAADYGGPALYQGAGLYGRPQVVYNWTGFYIGGHLGGAFCGRQLAAGQRTPASWAGVQGRFLTISSRRNWVMGIEGPSTAGCPPTIIMGVLFPGRHPRDLQQRPAWFGDRPGRLHLGVRGCSTPRAVYAWRGRAMASACRWPACRRPSPPMAATATATPSAAVSNTCFAPNWSAKAE